ncbi:MAG: Mur ligase domain-containing protein, partial [Bradymonadaceae bacterium]
MTAHAPRPFPKLPDKIEKIHIIGVCGTAMGSLAAMLKERGFTVRGSDAMAYPPMSDWLAERGIDIIQGYDEKNLDWNPDLVIVGNVCRSIYGDAVAMRERGFPYLSLPEALRYFFFADKRSLALTGTHGKTTTTSMLASILNCGRLDPTVVIGGRLDIWGGSNAKLGQGEILLAEADESDGSFMALSPTIAVVTN